MQTLNARQAAEFLKMHPVTLRSRAKTGEIPGAKIGKEWVFIDLDLADFIRSQYSHSDKRIATTQGDKPCSLKDKIAKTGILNFPLTEKLYTEALAPATKGKRKK